MPRFHYKAIDGDNRPVDGSIEAENRFVAVAQLLQDGLHVQEFQEIKDIPADSRSLPQPGASKDNVSLTDDRRLAVVDGMAEVVRSGLPLAAGLRTLASELPSRRTRRAMATISSRLEQGISIDDAVGGQSGLIPEHLQVLLRAGLHSGRLAELLEHYLHFARTSLDTRRRSVVTLFYPLLLILVTMLIAVALLVFIVPAFESIFLEFELSLPDFTLAVLWMADMVSGWRLAIFPALLIGLMTAWIVFGRVGGPLQRKCLYYVPALGRVIRLGTASRFCHLLAIGIDHRLPLPEALRLAGDGTSDAYIARTTNRMADDLKNGHSLDEAATTHQMLPEIIHVFGWEGHDDAFPEILRATGDICAAQSRVQSGLARAMIEPVAIFSTAAIVGMIVIALLLPIVRLLGVLV